MEMKRNFDRTAWVTSPVNHPTSWKEIGLCMSVWESERTKVTRTKREKADEDYERQAERQKERRRCCSWKRKDSISCDYYWYCGTVMSLSCPVLPPLWLFSSVLVYAVLVSSTFSVSTFTWSVWCCYTYTVDPIVYTSLMKHFLHLFFSSSVSLA